MDRHRSHEDERSSHGDSDRGQGRFCFYSRDVLPRHRFALSAQIRYGKGDAGQNNDKCKTDSKSSVQKVFHSVSSFVYIFYMILHVMILFYHAF